MSIVWHEYRYPAEVHIVPACERLRHRPFECWCDPQMDLHDGVMRFRHRVRGNDFLNRATA